MKLCTLGQPLQSSSPPVKKVEPRFSSSTSKKDLSKHQDDFYNPKDCNDGFKYEQDIEYPSLKKPP